MLSRKKDFVPVPVLLVFVLHATMILTGARTNQSAQKADEDKQSR
ncbi:MAG TPA: hypothetical protein VJ023_11990 [Pyrinomonadaceae bacterium]|nr:hypothetical protein [Pyrinomonadaceae bacterium]